VGHISLHKQKSEPQVNLLELLLEVDPSPFPTISFTDSWSWRRGSESNDVFIGCQPQYPDLQGFYNIDFTAFQEVFVTTRHLPDLTRHLHPAYSVIEEIVEGFIEGLLTSWPHCWEVHCSRGIRRAKKLRA
jgi:hypothetical protein